MKHNAIDVFSAASCPLRRQRLQSHERGSEWEGDVMASLSETSSLLDTNDLSKAMGLTGVPRYTRLPKQIIDAVAKTEVVRVLEKALTEAVDKGAAQLDALVAEKGWKGGKGKFASVDFTKQGKPEVDRSMPM